MAAASFCAPVWRDGGGGGGDAPAAGDRAYFRLILLTVKNGTGHNFFFFFCSPERRPANLESFPLSPSPFSCSHTCFYFSFREELAMRLDLTEARVQVSGPPFCPSYLCNGEGSGFMSSIKCCPRTELDYNR